jgi:uncharacterized membrane protein
MMCALSSIFTFIPLIFLFSLSLNAIISTEITNKRANPVKALGIFFGHNKEECQKLNWEKKIEEMKNQFTAWGKRNLTIIGKILIILPKFTFDVFELSSLLTHDTLSDAI